mmetsp:Transcript_65013/g.119694  ORF Transcript_65013/g.119694 Transcript_65013/m.119694 type:complete len:830 (+) Transcript_65013:76-2565(+)
MAPKQPTLPLQGGAPRRSVSSPGLNRPQSASSGHSESRFSAVWSPIAGHVGFSTRNRRRSSVFSAVGSDAGTPSPISKGSEALASPESPSSALSRSKKRGSTLGDPYSPDSRSPEASLESPGAGRSPPSKVHLLEHITYESPTRSQGYDDRLQPLAAFLKNFVGRHQFADEQAPRSAVAAGKAQLGLLQLWVPDTVVWEEGQQPIWYYSDEQGCVARTQEFKLQDIYKRFQRRKASGDVVAVMKRPVNRIRNQTSLLDTKRLSEYLLSVDPPVVLQRFIRSQEHPSLLRCCWKRGMACEIHHIANSREVESHLGDETALLISLYRRPASSFQVNAVVGMLRAQLSEIMDRIVKYLALQRGLLFDELVCDFVRDETLRLWFLQVKAFTRRPREPDWPGPGVWSGEPQEPGDRARCGLCECSFRLCDLRNALNTRQLNKIHERLRRWRGSLPWTPTTSLIGRDATTYQMFRVCDDCYSLHCALEDLARAGASFNSFMEVPGLGSLAGDAKDEDALGVGACWEDASDIDGVSSRLSGSGSWSDTKYAAMALSPPSNKAPFEDELTMASPTRHHKTSLPQFSLHTRARHMVKTHEQALPPPMPFDWQCPLERLSTQAVVHTKRQGSLLRFRLLVFVHSLRGDVDELRQVAAEQGLLCLTWAIFGAKRCVALQLDAEPSEQEERCCVLPVHALGSQHLYAKCPEAASEWVSDCPHLAMYLVAVDSGQRLACASFDLRHVVKDKLDLQSFEVPLRGLGITLWIRATLGFGGGAAFDCERVKLTTHTPGRVYVPQSSITGPEALPNSWLGLLSGVSLPLSELDISRQMASTPEADS